MGKNNAGLYDPTMYEQANIKKPAKVKKSEGIQIAPLKDNIKKLLRIIDEQEALGRYRWYNLPEGLDETLIERVLYYRGAGMFFYIDSVGEDEEGRFLFLPYTLQGTIDVYGRYIEITPLPFNGKTSISKGDQELPWITGISRKPAYSVINPEKLKLEDLTEKCVILKDYSEQISQTILSRQQLDDGIIDMESDLLPFMRTALLSGTGVRGVRVEDEDAQSEVIIASKNLNEAALRGEKYLAMVGHLDFQDLTDGALSKAEEYLMAMEGVDNFRRRCLGLSNGGLFQKQAHMLQSELTANTGDSDVIFNDGLKQRQRFCDIVNSIWGLGICCVAAESATGQDKNADGEISDEQDQSGLQGGAQPEDAGGEDE